MRQISPQTQKHLDAGDRNRRLAEYVLRNSNGWGFAPDPHEWAITMAFYAALHYVDAYLVEHMGNSPGSHTTRNGLVSSVIGLRTIEIDYGHLYSTSRLARYDPMRTFSKGAVQAALNEMRYVMAEIGKIL